MAGVVLPWQRSQGLWRRLVGRFHGEVSCHREGHVVVDLASLDREGWQWRQGRMGGARAPNVVATLSNGGSREGDRFDDDDAASRGGVGEGEGVGSNCGPQRHWRQHLQGAGC